MRTRCTFPVPPPPVRQFLMPVPAGLKHRCSALFRSHEVHGFGGTFHVPDSDRYPALFAWDSGYHALSLLHFEPDAAIEELTTLYRANRLPDGLLSHQRYIAGAEGHQRFIESLFGPMFDGDRTPFIDPPTPAYAAARLSLALGAPADRLLDEAVSLRALWPGSGRWTVGRCRLCCTRSKLGPKGAPSCKVCSPADWVTLWPDSKSSRFRLAQPEWHLRRPWPWATGSWCTTPPCAVGTCWPSRGSRLPAGPRSCRRRH